RALPVAAGRVTPQAGTVGLVRRSIGACFIETAAARKDPERAAPLLAELGFDQEKTILRVHVGSGIDRAALPPSLLDVAVSAQRAARGQQAPGTVLGLDQQAFVVGTLRTVAGLEFSHAGGGPRQPQVDDAANGARTVKIAGTAAHQLDVLDGELGLL